MGVGQKMVVLALVVELQETQTLYMKQYPAHRQVVQIQNLAAIPGLAGQSTPVTDNQITILIKLAMIHVKKHHTHVMDDVGIILIAMKSIPALVVEGKCASSHNARKKFIVMGRRELALCQSVHLVGLL